MKTNLNHKDRRIFEVLVYGEPVLREQATPIEQIDGALCRLVEDMFATMYASQGVGLAAPQIGRSIALAVIDPRSLEEKTHPMVVINPRIVEGRGECSFEEGCLSIPDIRMDVIRPETIIVEGLDMDGKPICIEAGGALARVLQHEIDHLHGRLFIDHLGMVQRQMIEAKLQEIEETRKREGA